MVIYDPTCRSADRVGTFNMQWHTPFSSTTVGNAYAVVNVSLLVDGLLCVRMIGL